jgi:hypothetical protein
MHLSGTVTPVQSSQHLYADWLWSFAKASEQQFGVPQLDEGAGDSNDQSGGVHSVQKERFPRRDMERPFCNWGPIRFRWIMSLRHRAATR